jgi:FixJ family two-component response regulator
MTPKASRQNKHVYIVEDDQRVRLSLARALDILGYDVQHFDSAEAFLAQAVIFRPAVLVLDMMLPGITGVHLQADLLAEDAHLPVIFISGESSVSQGITAMRQGALDLLTKPFHIDRLVQLIDQATQQDTSRLQSQNRQQQYRKRLEVLRPRELEAYFCLAKGYSNAEMMEAMEISLPTAKQYRTAVMRELHFASLAELLEFHQILTSGQP